MCAESTGITLDEKSRELIIENNTGFLSLTALVYIPLLNSHMAPGFSVKISQKHRLLHKNY